MDSDAGSQWRGVRTPSASGGQKQLQQRRHTHMQTLCNCTHTHTDTLHDEQNNRKTTGTEQTPPKRDKLQHPQSKLNLQQRNRPNARAQF